MLFAAARVVKLWVAFLVGVSVRLLTACLEGHSRAERRVGPCRGAYFSRFIQRLFVMTGRSFQRTVAKPVVIIHGQDLADSTWTARCKVNYANCAEH